jgi:hypothetical protein
MATNGNGSAQQRSECYYWIFSKHATPRMGTPALTRSSHTHDKSESGGLRNKVPEELPHGNSGPE